MYWAGVCIPACTERGGGGVCLGGVCPRGGMSAQGVCLPGGVSEQNDSQV